MPMKTRKIPLRKCTGCGEMKDKREMVRIVRDRSWELFIRFYREKTR